MHYYLFSVNIRRIFTESIRQTIKTKTMTTTKLTKEETRLFNSLVRLGDSKELALETVLSERNKEVSNMYYQAYCL